MKSAALAARLAAPLAAAMALALGIPALAAPASIGDITGDWAGSGAIQRDDTSKPMKVNCTLKGEQSSPTQLGFAGECRAMLIMKRPIAATFVLDGDKVTGTYVGAEVGEARLDGRAVSPTEWTLDMIFPREINGDDKAVMTIINRDGEFHIITRDKMQSGAEVTTTDVKFSRK